MWLPGRLILMALGELLRSSSSSSRFWRVLLRLPYHADSQRREDLRRFALSSASEKPPHVPASDLPPGVRFYFAPDSR